MRLKEPHEGTNIPIKVRTRERIQAIWKAENLDRTMDKKITSYDSFLNEVFDLLEKDNE